MKRVVIISDLHCGHRAGLTPPKYQYTKGTDTRGKFAVIQSNLWNWYVEQMEALQPIDLLVINGDLIDGKGDRSGGTELIDPDRSVQADMAEECIRVAKANSIIIVYGTPYHAGKEEDWEAVVAKNLGADIKNRAFVEANGNVFDIKHHVSSSIIPHGRHTAPSRERLWNMIWAERGMAPKANIVIRSHVHYYGYAGDARGLAVTTPALQGQGSKFGARVCSGTVDIGFLSFDCHEKGKYDFNQHLLDITFLAEEAIKV